MSPTMQETTRVCNHERRPGTTVCLHCRHAERLAAGERRKKLMLRGTAAAIVIGLVCVTTIASAAALRGRFTSKGEAPVKVISTTEGPDKLVTPPTSAAPTSPAPSQPPSATVTPVAQSGGVPQGVPATAPFSPTIPPGETILRDSVLAFRTDSGVTVSFDRPMTRTRRPDKFEAFLRATLGQIYGAPADSALAHVPGGAIAQQGDLLSELPTRGIRIPVSDAWVIAVYPQLRQGKDGPLVIRYRVSVNAASDQH